MKEFRLLKIVFSTLLLIIPRFQHSMIPDGWDFDTSDENLIILICCRNSETLNYSVYQPFILGKVCWKKFRYLLFFSVFCTKIRMVQLRIIIASLVGWVEIRESYVGFRASTQPTKNCPFSQILYQDRNPTDLSIIRFLEIIHRSERL